MWRLPALGVFYKRDILARRPLAAKRLDGGACVRSCMVRRFGGDKALSPVILAWPLRIVASRLKMGN